MNRSALRSVVGNRKVKCSFHGRRCFQLVMSVVFLLCHPRMTGYGLLALTSASRLGEAFQAVRWLLERPMGSCDGDDGDDVVEVVVSMTFRFLLYLGR